MNRGPRSTPRLPLCLLFCLSLLPASGEEAPAGAPTGAPSGDGTAITGSNSDTAGNSINDGSSTSDNSITADNDSIGNIDGIDSSDSIAGDSDDWSGDYDTAEQFFFDGITVTGTRAEKRLADSPVATEIITAAEIENSSAATLSEVLDDYGLMYSSNAMGDYIQLQGLGESRVLYLIDGRRVPGRVAGRLNGETLPLDNVERIEIVRGPQSSLYGSDGIGGVVNIITKQPGDRFSLSAGISNGFILAYDDPATSKTPGPFDRVDPFRKQQLTASLGLPLGPTRNTLSLSFSRAGLYLDEGERSSILPRSLRGQASLDTALRPTDRTDLRAGGGLTFLQSDQQTNPSGSLARSDYIRGDGFISLDAVPRDHTSLTFRLYDTCFQRDRSAYAATTDSWANTGQFENENYAALEASGRYDGFPHWFLAAGLEASYNSMSKFNLTEKVNAVDREAVFIQAERFREGVYSVLGGFRVERNSQYGFSWAPRLSAMYHLPGRGEDSGFRLLGSLGVGYRAPNFNDLYLVKDDPPHPLILGNPDLRPEYAVNLSGGLEYAREKVSATLNGYYTELFDEIAYRNTGLIERGMAVYHTGNISRSLRAGFDTEGKVSLFRHAYVSAGYSYLYAYDRTANAELHPQPAHTLKFKAGLDTGKPGTGRAGNRGLNLWAGGRFFSPLDREEAAAGGRLILDLYAGVFLGKHVKVYASADNLLGTIDIFFGPAAPQSFSLGLTYTY
jgi:outer membrane receptor for ferrienterochelin and colicins